MNYFEFYNIPITFLPDEAALRKTFYANSKKYHPDFFTLSSEAEQAEVLELSTLNNEAFKTLSDPDRRMKYILELKGVMGEEGQNNIPQGFLMEMMDINEGLMELEFDYDAAMHQKLLSELEKLESKLSDEVSPLLETYVDGVSDTSVLEQIKTYFFKRRYLLRIQENLDRFASL
jgi:molecular chaperone HscB